MNKPTGIVTFLFTDIEGSTKLSQEFPETLPLALKRHHSILTEAINSHNGFIFKIIGDAFCTAFNSASDAVKSAIEAQNNLSTENWEDALIKVRMGIHSGNVEWNEREYMGYITLARTARIMSSAYGEQILISIDTYELAKEKLSSQISFRDLGDRRLKDVIEPIRLFQIGASGLREDFPPLKTLDARPNNLPVQLTSFIGREEEMKHVKNLLKQTHLLTLTGSGGAGKTRLSLQIAADVIDDFPNGVWFVELASLSEQTLLTQAIMKVLGLKEEPKRDLEETLCDYLRDKEILIILDNCEHLIEACSKLTEKLLSNSPKLKIIATSREALRCEGEQTHRVSSLEVPDPKDDNSPEKLSQYEAVRLFIERSLAVDETFRVNNDNAPALAQICFQLDGIPLAIELAAASTKSLSLEQIYIRLNDRFSLLTGGRRTALPRQQTLRALIDWSYDLLSEKEKLMWRRLSVFSGGWTLEAAQEVCSDEKIKKEKVLELLGQLTEKSITTFGKEKVRYGMLETIKQYGEEKLNKASEAENIAYKHLQYFREFSETAEPKLTENESHLWFEKLEEDHGNFQAAIERSIIMKEYDQSAILVRALGKFWETRGHWEVGRRMTEKIYDKLNLINESLIAQILKSIGTFSMYQGEYEKAKEFFERTLVLNRASKHSNEIAGSLHSLGIIAYYLGNYPESNKLLEESLKIIRNGSDKSKIVITLIGLGRLMTVQGNLQLAYKYYEESVALSKETGDKRNIAHSLNNFGNLLRNLGNYSEAQNMNKESLRLSSEIRDKRCMAESLNDLGIIAECLGNFQKSMKYYQESLIYRREIGDKRGIAESLGNIGIVSLNLEMYEQAIKYLDESLELFRVLKYKSGIIYTISGLGIVAFNQGNLIAAKEFFEESLQISREIGQKTSIAESLNFLGNILVSFDKHNIAEKCLDESLLLRREIGEKHGIASSLNGLGNLKKDLKNYDHAKKFFAESLVLALEVGNKPIICENILGVAEIIYYCNDFSNSIKLLGAANTIQESMGIESQNKQNSQIQKLLTELQLNSSNDEFLKYFEEGKRMTLQQAAEHAISVSS